MGHKSRKIQSILLLYLNIILCFYKSDSGEFGEATCATKTRKKFSGSLTIIKSPLQSTVENILSSSKPAILLIKSFKNVNKMFHVLYKNAQKMLQSSALAGIRVADFGSPIDSCRSC